MEIPAMAASLTESLRPIERAARERWEKDVFRASKRLTTMLMNWKNNEEYFAYCPLGDNNILILFYPLSVPTSWLYLTTVIICVCVTAQLHILKGEEGWVAYLSSLFCHGGDLVRIFCTEHRRQYRSQYTLKQARCDTGSITELDYLHFKHGRNLK